MSSKQYNLFGEETAQENAKTPDKIEKPMKLNALKLSKNDTKQESKLKKLISSRLKKIENLNRLFEGDKAKLQNIKDLYAKNLSDEVNKYCKITELYTEKLIKRYSQKSFANYQKDTLEYIIEDNFQKLYSNADHIDSIDALADEYNTLKHKQNGYDEFEDEDDFWAELEGDEFENEDDEDDDFVKEMADNFAKELIRGMLNDIGLEVDEDFFEGLNPEDIDFQDKFQERLFEYKEKQDNAEKAEAHKNKVLTTDKDFTKLYKSLVKKIHPDLTTDENERLRREDLMKELSNVWEERDYYKLMILQSKIDPEFNTGVELSKSQLQKVADDLLDKTRSIESERFQFKRAPKNEFYFSNFFASSDRRIVLHMENYKRQLNSEMTEIKNNIEKLKTQKTTKTFLKAINEKMEEDFQNDFWY
jgi:hypothetical protein